MNGVQIHVQEKGQRIFANSLYTQVHTYDGGVVVDVFDEGVMSVPEAFVMRVTGEQGDMVKAKTGQPDHQDDGDI